MLGALVYLKFHSFINLVASRLRRLRQPKYLFGALVGAAYFYFVFVHGLGRHRPAAGGGGIAGPSPLGDLAHDPGTLILNLGAVALLAIAVFMWVLPKQKPGLTFSEAEIAALRRDGVLHDRRRV